MPQEPWMPPIALMSVYRIADFDKWKSVFDGNEKEREKAGILGHVISRGLDDPNTIGIFLPALDRRRLEEFAYGDRMKERRREAGMQGEAMMQIVRVVENHIPGGWLGVDATVGFDVDDYDVLKKAFDDQLEARQEAGLIGHALARDADAPHRLVLQLRANKRSQLEAYLSSEAFEELVTRGGIRGELSQALGQVMEDRRYAERPRRPRAPPPAPSGA